MRICFDRLCFARQRPASSDNTINDVSFTSRNLSNTAKNVYKNTTATETIINTTATTTATTAITNVITTTPSCTVTSINRIKEPDIETTSATRTSTSINTAESLINTHRSVTELVPTDGALINPLDSHTNHNNINNKIKQKNTTRDVENQQHDNKQKLTGGGSESLRSHRQNQVDSLNSLRIEKNSITPTSIENILEKQANENTEIFVQNKKENQTTTSAADQQQQQQLQQKQQDPKQNQQETVNNQKDHHFHDDNAAESRHNEHSQPQENQQQQQQQQQRPTLSTNEEEEKLAKMQQEPNANIQFQPDLGLVNNNNLPTLGGAIIDNNTPGAIRFSLPLHPTDVLTHTLIYGTLPTGAQQLNADPNLQTRNILHQQELQLQQRYQQLQQLQAQTQGLLATSPTGPIVIQPTATGQPAAVYPTNPDYCGQHKYNLAAQMQGLCISNQSNAPSPTSSIMDPSGGVNLLSSSYVPATPQEERLIQIIHAKDLKIQEMQRALQYKDTEIAELKSHLDKFQSVFPFSRSGATTPCSGMAAGATGGLMTSSVRKSGQSFQRQRAQGISAEPQSESSVLLDNVTFPKYEKDEK